MNIKIGTEQELTGEDRRKVIQPGTAGKVGDGIFFRMSSCSTLRLATNQFLASRVTVYSIKHISKTTGLRRTHRNYE